MTAVPHAEMPWHWRIERCDDPWRDWLSKISFSDHTPLDVWVEREVEDVCRAADLTRLAVSPDNVPDEKDFAKNWAVFRCQHELFEDNWKSIRKRWLIWRATALFDMRERCWGQDDSERQQVRDKLLVVLREFGNYDLANGSEFWFWSLDDDGLPLFVHHYANIVLSLVQTAVAERKVGRRRANLTVVRGDRT